jgi:hypothetical protein
VTINPIVAPIGSRPGDPWAGIWLAEDVEAIRQGVTSGSWIDFTLGGVGAGLDTLAAVSDPLGTLMQYGLSWLMEHIRPLSEALDWLAGDPAQIAAHAQTWRNVAVSLRSDVATFGQGAATGVSGWRGTAATAYQTWASHQQTALGGLASAADTMASISDGVAYLIAGVRVMVRDAIATVVSRAIDYAGEEFFSFGLATPWVIEQVSTLVASWSARIGRWITALRDSVGRLTSAIGRLGEVIEALQKLLREDRGSIGGSPTRIPRSPSGDLVKTVTDSGGSRAVTSSGKTFVTTPQGMTYEIPAGWKGRVADNGKGLVFQKPGSIGSANMIRIMDPTPKYPNGYVRVYNDGGQPLDVFGKPGSKAATHIPSEYRGPWVGWPS